MKPLSRYGVVGGDVRGLSGSAMMQTGLGDAEFMPVPVNQALAQFSVSRMVLIGVLVGVGTHFGIRLIESYFSKRSTP
jgi:hypothetical protein